MRPKGRKNTVYSPEFKEMVVTQMRGRHLSYTETMRIYFPHIQSRNFRILQVWERIYLEEGVEGLAQERRGKSGNATGRPPKLEKSVEEDLIAENQRLRLENAYLKKLHALALSKMESENKTKPE